MLPQGREGLGHRVSCHLGYCQAHACLHCTGQLMTVLHHMLSASMLHLMQPVFLFLSRAVIQHSRGIMPQQHSDAHLHQIIGPKTAAAIAEGVCSICRVLLRAEMPMHARLLQGCAETGAGCRALQHACGPSAAAKLSSWCGTGPGPYVLQPAC